MAVAAAVSAVLAVASSIAGFRAEPPRGQAPPEPVGSTVAHSLCPPGSLPDQGVCIPVPSARGARAERPQALQPDIPRRPGRPEAFDRYAWPAVAQGGDAVGFAALHEGYATFDPALAGVVIPAALGSEVRLPRLEGEQGAPTVVYRGDLVGPTLVTKHRIQEGERERDYLLILGNLQSLAEAAPKSGGIVGRVGDPVAPGAPGLYLEVRRPRSDGFEASEVRPGELLRPPQTISVDPRNLVPVRK